MQIVCYAWSPRAALEFAADYLKVDYIFWSAQEPFYSKQLFPFLKH